MSQTIGILGGSFDPAHEGHIHISQLAKKHFNLQQIWWIFTPQNPLKPSVSQHLDIRMQEAIQLVSQTTPINYIRFFPQDIFTPSPYSIDLIKEIKKTFPEYHFLWLLGDDALPNFHKWYKWVTLCHEIPIAFFQRDFHHKKGGNTKLQTVMAPYFVPPESFARAWHRISPPLFTYVPGVMHPQSSTKLRSKNKVNKI